MVEGTPIFLIDGYEIKASLLLDDFNETSIDELKSMVYIKPRNTVYSSFYNINNVRKLTFVGFRYPKKTFFSLEKAYDLLKKVVDPQNFHTVRLINIHATYYASKQFRGGNYSKNKINLFLGGEYDIDEEFFYHEFGLKAEARKRFVTYSEQFHYTKDSEIIKYECSIYDADKNPEQQAMDYLNSSSEIFARMFAELVLLNSPTKEKFEFDREALVSFGTLFIKNADGEEINEDYICKECHSYPEVTGDEEVRCGCGAEVISIKQKQCPLNE